MISKKGFTIVELVIVIAVIGILFAISLSIFANPGQEGRDVERQTDMKALASLLEAHYEQHGEYPSIAMIEAGQLGNTGSAIIVAPDDESSSSLHATSSPTKSQYGYLTYTADMTPCTNEPDCGRKFALFWLNEAEQTINVQRSLH